MEQCYITISTRVIYKHFYHESLLDKNYDSDAHYTYSYYETYN